MRRRMIPQLVAEIVRAVMEGRRLSGVDIAVELGRSPRMVGKLLNGESQSRSRGEAFRAAVVLLRDSGVVDRRPARRRNKNNELEPVCVKRAAEHPSTVGGDGEPMKAPTVVPENTAGLVRVEGAQQVQ